MNKSAFEAAFRATSYRVDAGFSVFDLRIGEHNPGFSSWLQQQGISEWGIVTACNPGGRIVPDRNADRTRRLQEEIVRRGWRHCNACNVADAGDWPDEPGFCIFDVEANSLCAMAREFGQVAVVCGSSHDGRGELVWLDDC